ncbi:MAG: class I SAM-dependent methyltransferase [Sciscionella sp.]
MKALIRRRAPRFVRTAYREITAWPALLALAVSKNKQFLRFAPPGHFYSPIPDIERIRPDLVRALNSSVGSVPGVELNIQAQVELIHRFAEFYPEMPFYEEQRSGSRYYLDNDWYSYGDAVVLYSMMRSFEPKRIIEVGSGFSSAAMLEVNAKFFRDALDLTFIEPYPKRLHELLAEGDVSRCRIVQLPVQQVPVSSFLELRSGDFLFIDSSHIAKTGSDVLHLFFTVLPILQPGVIVHFHDILWPFEYPLVWLDLGCAWNEAFCLRAFLQFNDSFDVVYFNSYMEKQHPHLVEQCVPLALRQPSDVATPGNSSLWIRKKPY